MPRVRATQAPARGAGPPRATRSEQQRQHYDRKRTVTIREAIVDEQDAGSFLADMTDIEFAKYQQLIWQAETPKKLKQAKLGGGSS